MLKLSRVPAALVVCAVWVSVGMGKDPEKARVELRWMESKKIEGVTENKGYQTSCDPKDIMYMHNKPALVLTKKEVAEAELKEHDFSKNGLPGGHYTVNIHLTKEAREKLAASREGKQMMLLTVLIDGQRWGLYRYEKDSEKPFVPEQARAATFCPGVGFFSTKYEAEQLVEALK
jgi:hypothetical protein